MNFSLREIAQYVNGDIFGDEQIKISCLSSLDEVVEGSLIFSDGEANFKRAVASTAGVILTQEAIPCEKPLIIVKHPFKAFIKLLSLFYPLPPNTMGIHPTAVIAPTAILGNNICIGPYVCVGENSQIGNNCVIKSHVSIGANVIVGDHTVLHPHVVIYDQTHIGQEVCIHSGSVIGGDGFGYLYVDGEHLKVPHVGRVVIEDKVEIGANTCIDRATIGATILGSGTKIDNLVQVAHSVQLGKNNILCAFTGIAGSTKTGQNVVCAANVGISDHVLVDDGVILTARAGVPSRKHLLKGNVYLGNPARPRDKAIEQELSVNRIPRMRKTLQALSEKITILEKHLLANKGE